MIQPVDTPSDHASFESITALILRIFRANGALLAAGDRLVADLGLTSARWQFLGAVAREQEASTVAQLARSLGVTRQAVQRIANELEAERVIAFRANPRHKRAPLIALTTRGQALFEQAMERQRPWAMRLGTGLSTARVAEVGETLDRLVDAIEEGAGTGS